jgi:2-amino-4-hydroxy-6-hydroxymethyldihydropteridine diphosphokinase
MYVYIGIGSNFGDRSANITNAIKELKNYPDITIEKISSIIETEPIGGPPQPNYLNAVIKIKTDLAALKLLTTLQDIEKKLGRVRRVKNAAQPIDLDILLYGDQIIDEPDLKVPHPRMFEREFVMQPLLEIEPKIAKRLSASAKLKNK